MAKKAMHRRSSLAALWNSRKPKWRSERLAEVGATAFQISAVVDRDYFALPRWARKGLKRLRSTAAMTNGKEESTANGR